jgi:catechol 2,3-dioxygenase-like lactoylglutathione lyase family enzyme
MPAAGSSVVPILVVDLAMVVSVFVGGRTEAGEKAPRSGLSCARTGHPGSHMSIRFDHAAIAATNKQHSARFLANLLGLPEPTAWGPFLSVHLDDGVHLDYAEPGIEFPGQHYALLVSDDVFDATLQRITAAGVPFSAGPGGPAGEINHHHGGRGVYFDDPDGHHFELLTKPYGADL